MSERGLERLGEPLVRAAAELKIALASLTDIMKDGQFNMKALENAMTSMNSSSMVLIGALTVLGSGSTTGQVLGGLLLGGAAITGLGSGIGEAVRQGIGQFHLNAPSRYNLGSEIGGEPSLLPPRAGP